MRPDIRDALRGRRVAEVFEHSLDVGLSIRTGWRQGVDTPRDGFGQWVKTQFAGVSG